MSTSIAVVLTESGMGIAADGLECEIGSGQVRNARVQKIFPVICNPLLAYGIAGMVEVSRPGNDEVLFNVAVELPKSIDRVASVPVPTLYYFVSLVAAELLDAFKSAIAGFPNAVAESVTRILFVGYHRGPQCVQLKIVRPVSEELFYKVSLYELKPDVPVGYGSQPILDRLLGLVNDPEFAKYRPAASFSDATINRAINIAKNCVLAHYGRRARILDPQICKTIGGYLHAATITPEVGFQWVEGCEYPPRG